MQSGIGESRHGIIAVRLRGEEESIVGESELGVPRDREARIGVLVERVELVVEHQLGDYVAAVVQVHDALVERRKAHERLRRCVGENLNCVACEVFALVYRHVDFVLD